MIPVRLTIKGFLSYRDPVSIDFTPFSLAAISGANGSGKSSLTDAITWALFGQARRSDDAVINGASSAAEVTFDFDYEGQRYRVQRSKAKNKTTVLEFFVLSGDGVWKPLTEHRKGETDKRIQQVLRMDYETFTNASFFLQGKADAFAQQGATNRKKILSNILGLEVWEAYRKETAERRKAEEVRLITKNAQLREVMTELGEEEQRRNHLEQLERELSHLGETLDTQNNLVENLKRLADSLEQQRKMVEQFQKQSEAAERNLEQLEQKISQREAERDTYTERLAARDQIVAAHQKWKKLQDELKRLEQVAASNRDFQMQRSGPLMLIETERVRLEQELIGCRQQQAQIQASLAELPELQLRLDSAEGEARRCQEQLEYKAHLEEELRSVQMTQAEASAENQRLKLAMDELKERIDQLKVTEGAECPLCGQPLSPEERENLVASLNQQGAELGNNFRANKASKVEAEQRQKAVQNELSQFRQIETDLRRQQLTTAQLTARIEQIHRAAEAWGGDGNGRLGQISECLERGEYAVEARRQLAEIDQSLLALGYDAAAHDEVKRSELAGRESQEQLHLLELAEAALAPLNREIAELLDQRTAFQAEAKARQEEYEQAANQYEQDSAGLPDVDAEERKLFELRSEHGRLLQQIGGARQKVEILKTQRVRQAELEQQCGEISRQIARLNSLERAFSKDGIPALLIEQALPEIEEHANDLLGRLSNGTMSVRFQTQRDYADKKREDKYETLDILISDTEGQRGYEMFSGGEAFRVNFAIRLALSRVLAQRSGARLQTLVIDEGFGSQDNEGRQRLLEAIAQVRDDFAKILIITHLEELKDAFEARIEVEKTPTGSQVKVNVA